MKTITDRKSVSEQNVIIQAQQRGSRSTDPNTFPPPEKKIVERDYTAFPLHNTTIVTQLFKILIDLYTCNNELIVERLATCRMSTS